MAAAAKEFSQHGVVVLRKFLRPQFVHEVREIARTLFEQKGHRRDFLNPETDNSPRNLNIVGGLVMDLQPRIMGCIVRSQDPTGCPPLSAHVLWSATTRENTSL